MTWDRFKSLYYTNPRLGLALDISRMPFPDDFLAAIIAFSTAQAPACIQRRRT